jgi:predicted component of type VI protein secretion system
MIAAGHEPRLLAMNVLRLHPDNGSPPISIEQPLALVGRDPSSDVHLKDASVSRRHAEITLRGEEWVIVDQKSGNGIHVDGRRTQEAVLLPGQQLQIGNLKFRVEIDRGDDGSTVVLGRSPLLEDLSDRTLMGGAPPPFPHPPLEAEPPSRRGLWMGVALVAVTVLIGLAFAAVNHFSNQRLEAERKAALARATPRPTPTPTPTPTPVPTPTPTPVPVRRPTGSLLVSTDVDVTVSIDGRTVAQLKAAGLRRFDVAPGEHIVRFRSGESQTEVLARVRVNEQTVVRHSAEPTVPAPASSPAASPTPR